MKRVVTLAGALAALGVSACGDGESRVTATSTSPTTTTAEPADSGVPEGVAAQYSVLEDEIAEEGGAVESGPWRIAYIQEPAEGWFRTENGRVVWRDPALGETAHLEIIPIERDSGRIVPDAGAVQLEDPEGNVKELGPLNSNTTKIGVIHADAVPTLGLTNPNGQVDLRQAWLDTEQDTSTGDDWLYFAWERDNNTGSGFIAYEFMQNPAPRRVRTTPPPVPSSSPGATPGPTARPATS